MDCLLFGLKCKLFEPYINDAPLISSTYKWEENVNIQVLRKIRTYISRRADEQANAIDQPRPVRGVPTWNVCVWA